MYSPDIDDGAPYPVVSAPVHTVRSRVVSTPVNDLDLPELNLLAMADRSQMMVVLDDARSQHWLARTPLGYVITRYEEGGAFLRDRRFHSAVRLIGQGQIDDPRWNQPNRTESILSAEGDTHARLRRLVASAFSPKAADRLRPVMRDVVSSLIAPVAGTGHSELMADVCEPYPIPIMCELLGAPKEDWKLFSQWAPDLLRVFNNNLAADIDIIISARDNIRAYVIELVERRRRDPQDDLLTALIAAEEAGDRLSNEELVMMVEAVIVGGTDTTRNQLGCSVALLAQHPDQWAMLAERPELANNAVEETMRFLGAVRGSGRFAPEDLEFNGVMFPQGTLILPSFIGANFDPEAFPDPKRFDITRPPGNVHATFGAGIHYCLGASLARAELQEALPLLARAMPGLVIDGEVTWKPASFGVWGPEQVPLTFTPT